MEEKGETQMTEIAVQIRNSKNQREIGVAVRKPRARSSCVKGQAEEDTKQWSFELYSFTDSKELIDLETLLVQLNPLRCYLPVDLCQDQLVGEKKKLNALLKSLDIAIIQLKVQLFRDPSIETNLCRLLGEASLTVYNNELAQDLAMGSLCALINALDLLADPDSFGCYTFSTGNMHSSMQLDSAAIRSLNLLPDPSLRSSIGFGGSVMEILNRGKTMMGRRLLERWIRQPSIDVEKISERQDIVQFFVDNSSLRMEMMDECMKGIPDLEKLASAFEKKKHVKIEDLVTVYDAAKDSIPRICSLFDSLDCGKMRILCNKFKDPLRKVLHDLSGYNDLVEEVIDLDSRPTLVINPKHDEELQRLRNEWNDVLADIEEEHRNARETIGGDIKCEKDKTRGFVFRVTNKKEEPRLSKLSYVHICQVLVNGIHFTTSKLKSLAGEYRRLRSEYNERQTHLLQAAVDVASTYVPVLEATSSIVSELDVLLGFAHAACHAGTGYCRPEMVEKGDTVFLTKSRHPCVELQDHVNFIPNDYEIRRSNSRFQLITGPNMGGKSTYIRQLGTIVVMAQIGSFVPAEVARLPIFDKLLVRVGAGDLQQRGVSTFMMEMLEASSILHKATNRSLVIIDELGRGTSTYDGFGLAWAISEYLLTKVHAMCLFATHFHELTALEKKFPDGFCNKHVSAYTDTKEITMIYQVQHGPCMESFGVHVAKLAGFPDQVLQVAKRKSDELEKVEYNIGGSTSDGKKARVLEFVQKFAAIPINKLGKGEAVTAVQSLGIN